MSNIDVSSQSTGSNPFTQLILDFKGKNLPSEQIEADYNNTLNYPNNYFVAPERWRECFYTTSRKNMLLLSEGFENIVRVKPPFNRYIMLSLFQTVRNFNSVKEQYIGIAPLTKKLYLIGPTELAAGVSLPNTEIIDRHWFRLGKELVDYCTCSRRRLALVAEEFETGRYRGLFTTNLNLANRCLEVLKGSVRTQKIDMP